MFTIKEMMRTETKQCETAWPSVHAFNWTVSLINQRGGRGGDVRARDAGE